MVQHLDHIAKKISGLAWSGLSKGLSDRIDDRAVLVIA